MFKGILRGGGNIYICGKPRRINRCHRSRVVLLFFFTKKTYFGIVHKSYIRGRSFLFLYFWIFFHARHFFLFSTSASNTDTLCWANVRCLNVRTYSKGWLKSFTLTFQDIHVNLWSIIFMHLRFEAFLQQILRIILDPGSRGSLGSSFIYCI